MRTFLLGSVAALAFAVPAQAAIVVETTNFISSPTKFNGFEAIATDAGFLSPIFYSGTRTYTEDGISVAYVGGGGSPQEIWLTYLREGNFGWYNDGGGNGYTRITMADGSDFGAIQFLAGSGFGSSGTSMQYLLLNNGVAVATGVAGVVGSPLRYYGFSGGGFDEVLLQNRPGGAGFDGSAYEALAIDSIAVSLAGGVPEPAAWAMMLAGFGLVGSAMRRREKVAVTFA